MAHHRIEYDYECKQCKGTGLYVGMAERDGAAVVCHGCQGTGKAHNIIEYDDFDGRKEREAVRRVYEVNPGICVGEGGGYKLEDFGGVPYADWLKGGGFPEGSEMRAFTCPAWWYQSADYAQKPEWGECYCVGRFAACSRFAHKETCWARFDAEHTGEGE